MPPCYLLETIQVFTQLIYKEKQ